MGRLLHTDNSYIRSNPLSYMGILVEKGAMYRGPIRYTQMIFYNKETKPEYSVTSDHLKLKRYSYSITWEFHIHNIKMDIRDGVYLQFFLPIPKTLYN